MERIETLRSVERDELLTRVRNGLKADPCVVAAWLYGSFGRGEGDSWSDLDIWIVIADEAYDPALRHEYPALLRDIVFTVEAPQNGPSGGTYVMSAHDAPTGPHLIDWYLQPLRYARRPESQAVLLCRSSFEETPAASPPNPEFSVAPEEDARNKASLFWAMHLIQAKYIARTPVEENIGFEGFIVSLLSQVAHWRGVRVDLEESKGLRFPMEKLDRLQELGAQMAGVEPRFAHPREAVERFFGSVRKAVEK